MDLPIMYCKTSSTLPSVLRDACVALVPQFERACKTAVVRCLGSSWYVYVCLCLCVCAGSGQAGRSWTARLTLPIVAESWRTLAAVTGTTFFTIYF